MSKEQTPAEEMKDFIRFLCDAWYKAHSFVMENCVDMEEISEYSMVQGTRNQIALMRIGQQPRETDDFTAVVSQMLDADEPERLPHLRMPKPITVDAKTGEVIE